MVVRKCSQDIGLTKKSRYSFCPDSSVQRLRVFIRLIAHVFEEIVKKHRVIVHRESGSLAFDANQC